MGLDLVPVLDDKETAATVLTDVRTECYRQPPGDMIRGIILRRSIHTLPTLLGVIVVVFVLLRVVPGDPIVMMIPSEATPADVARLRAFYGLDGSLTDQFVAYIRHLLVGNLGTSITMKQDVLGLVLGRLPATLELAVTAITIAVLAGTFLALTSIYSRARWLVAMIDGFNSIALAIPEFLWGLLLILAFGVLLPWLPISGRYDPSQATAFTTGFYFLESVLTGQLSTALQLGVHLLLPALTLALPLIAIIARVLRSSLQSVMTQDYIGFARVHGFGRLQILLRYALPNALLPTLTVTGTHFVFLVGGTVLVELIFAYPGIGNMLYTAAVNRDLPLIQGVTIIFAVLFIFFNLAIDLAYSLVDPRVRHR
jgi:peptide/nickel transport system permease protein